MVVVMQEGATEDQIQNVINRLMHMGFDIHRSTGARHTVLGAVGAKVDFDTRDIELLEGVEEVLRISAPYKLASRHFRPEGTVVSVGRGAAIGGEVVVEYRHPKRPAIVRADAFDVHIAQIDHWLRKDPFDPSLHRLERRIRIERDILRRHPMI